MTKPTQAQIEAAAEAIFCHEIEEGLTIARERGHHHDAMAKAALTAAAEAPSIAEIGAVFPIEGETEWEVEKRQEVESAIAATIERCAKVADKYAHPNALHNDVCRQIAAAIRALATADVQSDADHAHDPA